MENKIVQGETSIDVSAYVELQKKAVQAKRKSREVGIARQDIEDIVESARSSARTMALREKKRNKGKGAEEDDEWWWDARAEWEKFSSSGTA